MDHLEFEKDLGEGSFGNVKLYRNVLTSEKVAVKTIRIKEDEEKEEVEQSFQREIESLRLMTNEEGSEYVLQYKDSFSSESGYHLVTEYLEGYVDLTSYSEQVKKHLLTRKEWKRAPIGKSYEEYLRRKPRLDKNSFDRIVQNLLNGLMYIHSKGLAHRDIKPDNIMIHPRTLKIKYIDFGIATNRQENLSGTGTFFYVGPEVIRPNSLSLEACQKGDIWGLAHVIWELRYGIARVSAWKKEMLKNGNQEVQALTSDIDGKLDELYISCPNLPSLEQRDQDLFPRSIMTRKGKILPSMKKMIEILTIDRSF